MAIVGLRARSPSCGFLSYQHFRVPRDILSTSDGDEVLPNFRAGCSTSSFVCVC